MGGAPRRKQGLHRRADRLGRARPDGRWRGRQRRRAPRHRLPAALSARRAALAGPPLDRHRLPAGVLPALSRLQRLLPADGHGALPQPHAQQRAARRLRHVIPGRHVNTTAPRLGIVTGLASEARLIAETGAGSSRRITVVCAGANSGRAVQLAETLVAGGATALLSFGIAGALHPALEVGDLVLAESVRSPGGQHHPCHDGWHRSLHAKLSENMSVLRSGTIYGSTETLLTVAQKSQAHAASACLAVDMESHAVAAVAER
ncbi:MAG TPA: hypothetical protein EYH07_19185, partial [Kiloniellaceae bacterium]|nr:hypothetical protein [Kiloniellaceae bacterium]